MSKPASMAPSYEVPTSFRPVPFDTVLDFIRSRPLCTLIGSTAGGLHAGHLPVFVETAGDGGLVLRGHVARGNLRWRDIGRETDAIAIFGGQESYAVAEEVREETAAIRRAETLGAVHLYGRMRLVEDEAYAVHVTEELTERHAAGMAHAWNTRSTPAEVVARLLAATVGVEMTVTRAEACGVAGRTAPATAGEISIDGAAMASCRRGSTGT